VEVPLAQTGEGIAECELLRWFVAEVSAGPAATLVVAPSCGIAPWGIGESSYNCGLWSYTCRNRGTISFVNGDGFCFPYSLATSCSLLGNTK